MASVEKGEKDKTKKKEEVDNNNDGDKEAGPTESKEPVEEPRGDELSVPLPSSFIFLTSFSYLISQEVSCKILMATRSMFSSFSSSTFYRSVFQH